MINRLLLDYVRKVPIKDVLDYYEIDHRKEKPGFISCLFHDERTPSAKVYYETDTGYCFGCHKRFDPIDIIKKMENKEFEEAVLFLYNIFASNIIESKTQKNNLNVGLYIRLNDELRDVFHIVKGDKAKRMEVAKVMQTIDLHAEDNVLILKLYKQLLDKAGIND